MANKRHKPEEIVQKLRQVAEPGDIPLDERGADRHRRLEKALQHQATPQRPCIPPASARDHRPDGPEADHALTIRLDQSDQAAHSEARLEFHGADMNLKKNSNYRNALSQRVNALGLANRVYFGGFVADPITAMSGKFAALNMSRAESFSMTVLEASAAGLLVIASRSGGPEEIILDGATGLLVPIDDAEACASAMLRMCYNSELAHRLGSAGSRRILQSFSKEAYTCQLRALFGDLE